MKFFKRNKTAGHARVGLCLRPDSYRAVALTRLSDNQLKIHAVDDQKATTVDERDRQLASWVSQLNLAGGGCVDVLPTDAFKLAQVDLGKLPEEERRDAARWQLRELVDYRPQDAVIDLFEVKPFSGERAPVTYAVAAHDQLLRRHLQAVNQSDLQLEAIDLPEFALRNICNLFAEERGVAILLLHDEYGILTVVRDGDLYLVRVLSIGMNDLANVAEAGMEALAEQLDSVVLEVQRSFDYCESSFQLPQVARLLVAQTGHEIPALINYLNEYLTTRVEPFRFPDSVELPEGMSQLELNRFLVPIGGALRQEQG